MVDFMFCIFTTIKLRKICKSAHPCTPYVACMKYILLINLQGMQMYVHFDSYLPFHRVLDFLFPHMLTLYLIKLFSFWQPDRLRINCFFFLRMKRNYICKFPWGDAIGIPLILYEWMGMMRHIRTFNPCSVGADNASPIEGYIIH